MDAVSLSRRALRRGRRPADRRKVRPERPRCVGWARELRVDAEVAGRSVGESRPSCRTPSTPTSPSFPTRSTSASHSFPLPTASTGCNSKESRPNSGSSASSCRRPSSTYTAPSAGVTGALDARGGGRRLAALTDLRQLIVRFVTRFVLFVPAPVAGSRGEGHENSPPRRDRPRDRPDGSYRSATNIP